MKLQGEATIPGEPEQVFDRLQDPELLKRCIPGCEELSESPGGVHEGSVRAGVGAIKGRFKVRVTLSDVVRPKHYHLTMEAKGSMGRLAASALVQLAPQGSATHLVYEGDVKVAGMLAAVGQRLLASAARKFASDFFENLI